LEKLVEDVEQAVKEREAAKKGFLQNRAAKNLRLTKRA